MTPDRSSPRVTDSRARNSYLVVWIALAAYVALGIVLLLHHETWGDEADSWLISRDAPLMHWPALLGREGTPALWYLILLPFAKAGLPYAAQAIIHLLLASAAAAIVLFFAPFNRLQNVLIIFSYYMGYEYLAIARAYTLTVLLFFALAVFYRKRDERPIAFAVVFALFVNTTVHALVIGAVIGPVLAWHFVVRRTRPPWAAIAIMVAGGVVAGLPILLAGRHMTITPLAGMSTPRLIVNAAAFALAPLFGTTMFWAAWGKMMVVLPLVVFVAASIVLARDRSALAILWLSWAALLFIIVFVRWAGFRHSGLLLVALIFSLWIAEGVDRRPLARALLTTTLFGSLFLSLLFAMRAWRLEVLYPYSGSKAAAAYLLEHHLENRPIAAQGVAREAVLAYLPPRQFWYPNERRYGTYEEWGVDVWSSGYQPADVATLETLQKFRGVADLLILTNDPLTIPSQYRVRVLYATNAPVLLGGIMGNGFERFWLYERIPSHD